MVNKVILIGRLAADPEVRTTANGTQVANLRLATNTYGGKNQDGTKREYSDFHQHLRGQEPGRHQARTLRLPQPGPVRATGRSRPQLPSQGTPRLRGGAQPDKVVGHAGGPAAVHNRGGS